MTEQQIRDLAARSDFGAHRATYRSLAEAQARQAKFFGRIAIGSLVLALAFLAFQVAWMVAICGVAVFVAGLRAIRLARVAGRNRDGRLDLFERGLILAFEGRLRAFRYDRTSVQQAITRHKRGSQTVRITYAYTMTDLSGEKMTLREGLAHPELWGPAIQKAVTDAQLPNAVARLRAGERLDFGPLWLTASEVGSRSKSVAWPKVDEVQIRNGIVSLRVTGKWLSLSTTSVSSIPNFFVFLALADHLRTNARA
ncbi:DUF6585 family protein [Spirillospora sp. NPDC052269]